MLVAKRREKGVTQDELASHVGVSKASVSKWETGQSYPDITLLPILASYFDVSIDKLMDYSPQMTKTEITKIYEQLAAKFAAEPFEDVIAESESLVKKYYSCHPLLEQIVQLYINHAPLAANSKRKTLILQSAIGLCEHIRNNCLDVYLTRRIVKVQALCHLSVNEPEKAIELLGDSVKIEMPGGALISQAFQMLGNTVKANEVIQVELYINIMAAFSGLLSYIQLNITDFKISQTAFEQAESMSELFQIRQLNPNSVAVMYVLGAHIYQAAGRSEDAIKLLEKYVDVCIHGFFPFVLHGDEFFDKIDGWLAENAGNIPRNESIVKESMLNDVLLAKPFESLRSYPEYTRLISKLRDFIGEK